MPSIADNIKELRQKIIKASGTAGRDPSEVKLMAVVKTVDTQHIFEALDAGIDLIGENKIQEAKERVEQIRARYPNVKIHFIGHLQSNKINQALQMFDLIESVDGFELAEAIDKRAQKPVDIFIEVNTSGEESKFGVAPEKAEELIDQVSKLKNIKLSGLMTIGILSDDKRKIRDCFAMLRKIREDSGYNGLALSMGMTDDFEVAIEEGSDIIRIGRAIFGARRNE